VKTWKVLALLLIAVLAWAVWSVVSPCCGARRQPSTAETLAGRKLRWISVPAQARRQANPVPASPEVLQEAMRHFADHCASCHGNDGSGDAVMGRHLYPPVPDMRQAPTQQLSDGELYWIVHNGVPWTGMPAWGDAGEDRDSWKLVHFIRHLPRLSSDELREMQRFNPISRSELEEENAEREFLNSADTGAKPKKLRTK